MVRNWMAYRTEKTKKHMEVRVNKLPECDFCQDGRDAEYDAKTSFGSWANMCKGHWLIQSGSLGLGVGQKLIIDKE